MTEMDTRRTAQEPDISRTGPFVGAMLGTLLFVMFFIVMIWWVFQSWQPSPEPSPMGGRSFAEGQPRLQVDPLAELSLLNARATERLHSTGWVDRDAGVVHIPIDRAMALLVERGLPEPENAAEHGPPSSGAQKP